MVTLGIETGFRRKVEIRAEIGKKLRSFLQNEGELNIQINGRIENNYIVDAEATEKRIQITPKAKGGSLNIHFQNVRGMPSNHKNKHKLRLFRN